jgi:hypothetical protein
VATPQPEFARQPAVNAHALPHPRQSRTFADAGLLPALRQHAVALRIPLQVFGELLQTPTDLPPRQVVENFLLVLATGADSLPLEAPASVRLAAVEQAREKPKAVARWTDHDQAFFQGARKQSTRGKRNGAGDTAPGPSGDSAPAATDGNPAP